MVGDLEASVNRSLAMTRELPPESRDESRKVALPGSTPSMLGVMMSTNAAVAASALEPVSGELVELFRSDWQRVKRFEREVRRKAMRSKRPDRNHACLLAGVCGCVDGSL